METAIWVRERNPKFSFSFKIGKKRKLSYFAIETAKCWTTNMYQLNYVQGSLKCPRSFLIKEYMWWEHKSKLGLEEEEEKWYPTQALQQQVNKVLEAIKSCATEFTDFNPKETITCSWVPETEIRNEVHLPKPGQNILVLKLFFFPLQKCFLLYPSVLLMRKNIHSLVSVTVRIWFLLSFSI